MARLHNENVNHIKMEIKKYIVSLTKEFQRRLVTNVDYFMPLIILCVYMHDWKKLVNK